MTQRPSGVTCPAGDLETEPARGYRTLERRSSGPTAADPKSRGGEEVAWFARPRAPARGLVHGRRRGGCRKARSSQCEALHVSRGCGGSSGTSVSGTAKSWKTRRVHKLVERLRHVHPPAAGCATGRALCHALARSCRAVLRRLGLCDVELHGARTGKRVPLRSYDFGRLQGIARRRSECTRLQQTTARVLRGS